jgi:hypothetical protein
LLLDERRCNGAIHAAGCLCDPLWVAPAHRGWRGQRPLPLSLASPRPAAQLRCHNCKIRTEMQNLRCQI